MGKNFRHSRGFPIPYGPTKHAHGFNFSVFSKNAKNVSLVLFEEDEIIQEIALNPLINKTGDVWHIFVYELPATYHYGYRLDGPYDPLKGHYFDKKNVVLDPYAKLIPRTCKWGELSNDTPHINKAVVYPLLPFHWENDSHPNIPLHELIIYEMHVRGFTQDPSSQVKAPGTFLGIIEKIPYLKSLGVNALEFLPIHAFNEKEGLFASDEARCQYWGYSTLNFFSPMSAYATSYETAIVEFKTCVKELHANGIEVILDVVYNHTSEGNQCGPILSFKGFENSVYYMLGPNGEYYNFSGCGNTFNCNTPVTREFIKDTLRYWVTEMHVDGFRFDLASIMTRDHDGIPLERPPLIEALTLDPVLANVKLIAEAWDAAGLYQVGSFPGQQRWAEWNGVYRDTVRRFIKGTDGQTGSFATRLGGSEDLYGKGRTPARSINYITAHDGFTLADLVSYNEKHNTENGEENRDGMNNNDSWNCGTEGETDDPAIIVLRDRQMRNFHVALMVSQGVPMILMGDEYGHSKKGNNNTWCLDNPLNWFQWDKLEENHAFFRFNKMLIAFRKKHAVLSRDHFLKECDIKWHGLELQKPNWGANNRFCAFSLFDQPNNYTLYIAFNAHFEELTCKLPPKNQWKVIVDTSNPTPDDIREENEAEAHASSTYTLAAHSALILKSKIHL